MSYLESLDFVYRLVFARVDLPIWFWSILAFALSLVLVHFLWGLAWNARWGLFKRPGVAITSIVLALVIGTSVLTWLTAGRSGEWLQLQRTELPRQFTDSGVRNRRIFVDACERVGQGCDPSQNAMTLHNQRDLQVLAEVAATSVECPLTPSGPLGRGSPCRVRDSAAVAQDVIRALPAASFPLPVSPDNPWIKAAVTAQIQEALSYATPRLQTGMTELRTLMAMLFWSALALQVLLVPIAAVTDIRIHPTV